jgi:hypothetical protein
VSRLPVCCVVCPPPCPPRTASSARLGDKRVLSPPEPPRSLGAAGGTLDVLAASFRRRRSADRQLARQHSSGDQEKRPSGNLDFPTRWLLLRTFSTTATTSTRFKAVFRIDSR